MGIFGSKKTKTKPLMLSWQKRLLPQLSKRAEPGAFERLSRAGEAYPGDLTAGLSGPEKTGLDTLEGWLGSDLPSKDPLFGMGREEYERTLGSDYYDPSEGKYYQAYREAVMRELGEAKDRLAAKTSARDQFYSGGRVAGEGELEETAMGDLALMLGQLSQRERELRLGSVPGALNLLGQEEMYPLARVAGSQEYGALPRELEQAGLDREYSEYLRQLQDLGIPLETALMLGTFKPDWSTKQSGGEFWDLLNPLAAMGGAKGGVTPTGGGGFQGLSSLAGMGSMFQPYGQAGGLVGPPTQMQSLFGGFGVGPLEGIGGLAGGAAQGLYGLGAGALGGIGSLIGLPSDIRFKENIAPIDNSLEKVKSLDGKTYNYTEAPEVGRGGIIAQDLEKVLPEAVKEINGVKFILLDAVIGLLVNAVKELDAKVERIGA